ncbi:MAG TPA: DUF4012 domain-containing protein [Candidatus Baltobacteraceae bacterium]|nr:DUF4012 domain-containing protein [Candidatus Baltobacteraceae bacterium]
METIHKHNLLGDEHRPRSGRKFWKYALWTFLGILIAVIVAGLAFVLPVLTAGREVYAQAQAARDDLFAAKAAAEKLDFEVASAKLESASERFVAAQRAHARLKLAAKLPFFRDEIDAVGDLLEGGYEASTALKEAIDVGADLIAVLRSGTAAAGAVPSLQGDTRAVHELSRDEKRELLRKLTEAPDRLGLARSSLERALAAWDRIPRTSFTEGILDTLAPYKKQLNDLHGILSQDLSTLAVLPRILGYPEPKTYLFLLLNNTELRPGGGFVGTYGIVKIADGEMDSFFTDDIYALDGPAEAYLKEPSPEPLKRYLHAQTLFMRDANWSPDFVVSALELERFYHLEGGTEKIDGVIGVTPTVIQKLLAMTGPITIEGTTFTADNVVDELEYQVEVAFWDEGTPLAQRKDVVGKLGQELVRRLLSTQLSDLPKVAAVAEASLAEKQLMASFSDPSLLAFADARQWSGRFRAGPEDRLAVIDANLASLKTDAVMRKSIAYSIRPDGDSWIARAAITYKNEGRFTWKTTRYRTYTRFYAPIGSRFLKGEGMMVDDKLNDPRRRPGTIDVSEELGHAVFGGFISVEPGETRTLAVEYRVSDAVARMIRSGSYGLEVQKQLGSLSNGLTLDLDFGKNVARATPPEDAKEWGDSRYRMSTDLRIDRLFSVGLK